MLTIAALMAGQNVWATTKTVTYTLSREKVEGRNYWALTHSGSTPFDGTTTVVSQSEDNATQATFHLPDDFIFTFNWKGGTVTNVSSTYFFCQNQNVQFSLNWSGTSRYVTNVSVTDHEGSPSSLNGSGTATTDYNYAEQGSASYTLKTYANFVRLVITYSDAPGLSIFESAGTNTYKIKDKHDLRHLADYVNNGNNECQDLIFRQTTNITCDNTYTPIGYYNSGIDYANFCGTYDGQGYTVSGITVTRNGNTTADKYVGLFGNLWTPGIVQNVVLASSSFTGYESVGGIVGYNKGGTVENCSVESSVTINAGYDEALYLGGIVGDNLYGKVIGCISAAVVSSNGKNNCKYYGGIVGENDFEATVKNCLYTGSNVEAVSYKGAIVGKDYSNNGIFSNNYYTSISLGGINSADQDGARRARTVTLGDDVTLVGDETAYDVSGLTAIGTGNYALSYNDGNATTLYSGKDQTLKLSYTGTVPTGYVVTYSATAGTLSGNTLTMLASNVTVTATLIQVSGTCGKTSNDNVNWEVTDTDGDGSYDKLTISGNGEMADYNSLSARPWHNYRNNITSVVIESGVTSIGEVAFKECTGLTTVTFVANSQLAYIAANAFYGCNNTGFTSIEIPASVTYIDKGAFLGCNHLASVTFGENSQLATIGELTFNMSGLTSITIPASVTSIGEYAFGDCAHLTSIDVDANNILFTSEDGVLFNKVKTTLIQYPVGKSGTAYTISVETIGNYAFGGCTNLTSITIYDKVTTIGDGAFYNCTGLTSLTIPASVETIGESAFENCENLGRVYVLPTTPPDLGSNAFDSYNYNLKIVVPTAAYSNNNLEGWSSYSNQLKRGYTVDGTNITFTTTNNGPLVEMGETVTLSYTGTIPDGDAVFYSIDGGTTLLVGNTFTMPDKDVTVTAVQNGPDQPFVVTTYADLKAKMATGGYIRVDADVSPASDTESYLKVPKDVSVTLDLNGHTVDQKYKNNAPSYRLRVQGTLTLNDSGTGGTIKGGTVSQENQYHKGGFGGGVFVAPTGEFTMNGGTITGGDAGNGGGGVYVANSDEPVGKYANSAPSWDGDQNAYYDMKVGTTASMDLKRHISGFPSPVVTIASTNYSINGDSNGSDIDPLTYNISDDDIFTFTPPATGYYTFGFSADGTDLAVAINVGNDEPYNPSTDSGSAPSGGTFIMNGGTISNNRADYDGGGVYVEEGCTFTMNGGTISGNTVHNYGGGVYANWGATVNLNGGTISGNTARDNGGGVFVKNCKFNVSGSLVITDNIDKDDNANNVYLPEGKTIKVSGALSADARIGVTMKDNSGVLTSGLSGNGTAANFTSDNSAYRVYLNGSGEAALGIVYVDENNAEPMITEYTVIESDITELNAGWYAVTDDVIINDRITCNGNVRLILCDGATLTAPEGVAVNDNDRLTIYGQTTGTGTLEITGSGSDYNAGLGGDENCASGVITINGGTVNVNIDNSYAYGAAIGGGENGEGFVYIYGGTVSASTSSGLGAGIGGSERHSGYVVIKGGHVTASSIGGGVRGGGSTLLSWTNLSDTIKADSYVGSVTLDKGFRADDMLIPDGSVRDKSTIAGKTLTPPFNIITETDGITNENVDEIPGQPVLFERTFTAGKASTVCLPFDYTPGSEGDYYTFSGITKENGKYVATMTEAASGTLAANTPYLFMPAGTEGSVPVTFIGMASDLVSADETTSGDWTFIGTYTRLTYGTAPMTGHIYGFAANSKTVDGHEIEAGDFVHAKEGASVPPMRCYLTYKNGAQLAPMRASALGATGNEEEIPSRITVKLVSSGGVVTSVGTLDMETGEVTVDIWYDMSGRPQDGEPTAPGLYIHNGKTIMIKQ